MNPKDKDDDPRYPYTHAADLLRMVAGYNEGGTKISRSDASNIRVRICTAMGLNDYEVACKFADYFLENQEVLSTEAAREFIKVKGWS